MLKQLLATSLIAGFLVAVAPNAHGGYAPGCTARLNLALGPHEGKAVAIQPDGRIVVAGYVDWGGDRDFLIARFHPNLTLDTSFNGTGYAITNFWVDDEALDLAITTDGKIVAVGYAENGLGTQRQLAIARYLPDGTLDPAFVGGGAIRYNMVGSPIEEFHGVALHRSGKIVAVGFDSAGGTRDILVARFLKNGLEDTSFGGTGFVGTPIGNGSQASDVLVSQGTIIVSATASFAGDLDFVALRYRGDGNLDTTFNGTGWSDVNLGPVDDTASSVALDSNDNIVVAGTSSNDIALVRYRDDGTPDGSFGSGGRVIHDIGTDAGYAVAVDGVGRIVVAGEGGVPNFALAQFDGTGSNTLSVSHDIANGDRAYALQIRKDGKRLLVGTSQAPGNGQLTLALFNPDGTQDCGAAVLHPQSDVTSGFVPTGCVFHYDCVNDEPGNAATGGPAAHNGLSDHVLSLLPALRELYRLSPPALPPGKVVTSIELVAQLSWTGLGSPPSAALVYRRPGFDPGVVQGPSFTVSNLVFQEYRQLWTNLNWNQAELDALSIGIDHVAGNDLRMTQMYVIPTFGDPPLNAVEPFTAAATGDGAGGQVTLNWLNPSYGLSDEPVIRRDTAGCPATPVAGSPVVTQADGIGQPGAFVDMVPVGPTYYYTAFVEDAENHASSGRCVVATPFDRTAQQVDWVYSTSDPTLALATPGLRLSTNTVYTATNDGIVHAVTGGDGGLGGGSWPAGWKPYRLGAKAPNRPPVVQLPGGWAALFGAEDGHVYAVDAATGALMWRSPRLGAMVSSSPAAILSAFGASKDLVFIGTRNAGLPNRFYALNAEDGTVAWFFDNGGAPSEIGIITSGPSVSYIDERVYFTSFRAGSGKTVWCLDFSSGSPSMCGSWTDFGVSVSSGGDVDSSPILHSGLVFVSDNSAGNLDAVAPLDGIVTLVQPLGGGGARDYVFPRFGTNDVIASTSSNVISVDTMTPTTNWTCGVSSPSAPLQIFGTTDVYVGGGDGKLHRFDAVAACPGAFECIGNCASTTLGSPAYDRTRLMIYLGTDEGNVYGVKIPF